MAVPGNNLDYVDYLDKPILPYRTNTSPTDDAPHFTTGSQNALCSVSGNIEKRPGFSAALEQSLSTIPGTIKRQHFWQRWTGSITNPGCYFCMVCAVTDTTSTVWKLNLGDGTGPVDTAFTLIYTDTTSTIPFDFQESNNFVFYGNATIRKNMRKFDGTDDSLWGVDAPIAAPSFSLVSGSLPPGLTFNTTTGLLSGTPTSTGETSITVTATDATGTSASQSFTLFIDAAGLRWVNSGGLQAPATAGHAYGITLAAQSGTAPYTYSISSGALPAGLTLAGNMISGTPTTANGLTPFAVTVTDAAMATAIQSFTVFVGSAALSLTSTSGNGTQGSAFSRTYTAAGGTAPYVYSVVGALPAGLAINESTGVISGTPINAGVFTATIGISDSAGLQAQFLSTTNISANVLSITNTSAPDAQQGVFYSLQTNASGGTQAYRYSFTSGALSAQTGYVWGYTYTSLYGHESAMSPLSSNSGLFTDLNALLSLIGSTDPQVNGINLYRSTDGGDQDPSVIRLISGLTNGNQAYTDSTEDIFLGTQTGPAFYLNNPPQPIRGLIWSNGRIYGYKNATMWFTGNEEITNGTPVECMSNAKNGNFYGWPSEVFALAVTGNGVDIALSKQWWQVSGDTLATFFKSNLLIGGGCITRQGVCVVGSTVYWIDTGKQFWSSSAGEIGQSIRPDLKALVPEQTYLVYHKQETTNWLVILDGANGKILIYDLDLSQWLAPWTIAATCIASGQSSPIDVALVAGFATGHVCELTEGTFTDDGAMYQDQIVTGLMSIIERARTTAANPTGVRQVMQFEMEANVSPQTDADGNVTGYAANVPDAVYALADDDPQKLPLDGWQQLGEPEPLQNDANYSGHSFLLANRWVANDLPMARRVALAAVWGPSLTPWKIYSMDIAKRAT